MPAITVPDLTDPLLYASEDPHPIFDSLRAHQPVHLAEGPRFPYWVVTKHADIARAFKDTQTFSTEYGVTLDTYRGHVLDPAAGKMLEFSNPEHHHVLRQAFNPSFTRTAVKAVEPKVRDFAIEHIEAAAAAETFDFAQEVAGPVTSAVVFGLLGFPQADWRMLFDLSRRSQEETHPTNPGRPPFPTSGAAANYELVTYLKRLIAPGNDQLGDGYLRMLMEVRPYGRPLTEDEVVLNGLNIMQGGNSTTRHAASGAVLALIDDPDQRKRVTSQRHLALFVEEIVRWTTPAIHEVRRAMRDVEIRGQQIRAGDAVTLWLISANRDEEIFPDPYTFDARRRPNPHLGFLYGPHRCLGINVARLELRILMEEILKRLPPLELAGEIERVPSNLIAGMEHLPVRVGGS